jgi:murein L,D-transpeptidase YcbB/YkuD
MGRSLSHGCVRVQAWDKLAYYILANDSISAEGVTGKYLPSDSITSWLVRKEKHSVIMKNRIPLFIRYSTCDVKDGKIVFYDDIYGEDKQLRDKYFAGK